MLKNEVKKTTTWPPQPSARQTGPKWTTHSALVKLCIKDILEYKQTANKNPPLLKATQHAICVCVSVFINNGIIAMVWLKILLLNIGFLVSHVDKYKLCSDILILDFKACFVKAVCLYARDEKRKKWS